REIAVRERSDLDDLLERPFETGILAAAEDNFLREQGGEIAQLERSPVRGRAIISVRGVDLPAVLHHPGTPARAGLVNELGLGDAFVGAAGWDLLDDLDRRLRRSRPRAGAGAHDQSPLRGCVGSVKNGPARTSGARLDPANGPLRRPIELDRPLD